MKELLSLERLPNFAKAFLQAHPKGAVVALSGELGAGKTTFVRAVLQILFERQEKAFQRVMSPSFVLHQSYPDTVPPVEHFDLYRLDNVSFEVLSEMGYYDALERVEQSGGFLFVEWPEKAQSFSDLHCTCQLSFQIQEELREIVSNNL